MSKRENQIEDEKPTKKIKDIFLKELNYRRIYFI